MHKHNKRMPNLWLLLIYLLLIISCPAAFFFPSTAVRCLLILLAAVQAMCLVLIKKTVSKMENDSAQELSRLKTSYHKKLRTLSIRLKKNSNAYKLLLTQHQKLKQHLERISESDPFRQTPESAYMLPFSESKEEALNLHAIAEETVRELETFSKAHHIRIQLVAAQKEILFTCSAEHMHILFRNIIDNSIKYMCRPGNLVITLSLIGDDIFIIFKDDGAGLPENELRHIFELNYQGSNRSSGNGLGLAQAKAIIDFYHGTVFAKSRPGNGMAVYIQLPSSADLPAPQQLP